jgi:hypothetical protein
VGPSDLSVKLHLAPEAKNAWKLTSTAFRDRIALQVWYLSIDQQQTNSVVLVLERTIQIERPPLVSEVCANFLADSWFSRLETLLFLPSKNLNCTHEVECTPLQTHYFSENLVVPAIESGPLDL